MLGRTTAMIAANLGSTGRLIAAARTSPTRLYRNSSESLGRHASRRLDPAKMRSAVPPTVMNHLSASGWASPVDPAPIFQPANALVIPATRNSRPVTTARIRKTRTRREEAVLSRFSVVMATPHGLPLLGRYTRPTASDPLRISQSGAGSPWSGHPARRDRPRLTAVARTARSRGAERG